MMSDLYASFNRHHERTVWMDVRSAELTKYASNAMLATRISFMNEMAVLCDELQADIDMVRRGIGADSRIGYSFLYAGCGYGGSCFPKDTQALVQTAKSHQIRMQVVEATEAVNQAQKNLLVDRLKEELGADLTGRKIAIWGLAFKPNTDDMREAPSRTIITQLLQLGATVEAFDPVATDNARQEIARDLSEHPQWLDRLTYADHEMQALENADALLIVTEWKHFHNPDFEALRLLMRTPLILDGRNLYNPETLQENGIAYRGIGRRNHLTIGAYSLTQQPAQEALCADLQ
jgi:UDPglucose 6-dehydrogenase